MFHIRTIPLAFRRGAGLPLPLHRTSLFPQPSQKHINRFVPHHVLASLVKGEVLSPEKIRATTGGIAPYPHQPSKTANTLASPRKRGGGLTALQNRYSTLSSSCNLPDCFQNCYTFCRQDGGDCVCLEDLKIVLLLISIPTVTARNSFRIVKAGLSEYCTASQKIISAVPPPLFRGEARYGAWLRQYRYQNDSDKA